jgi:hypothetical protein
VSICLLACQQVCEGSAYTFTSLQDNSGAVTGWTLSNLNNSGDLVVTEQTNTGLAINVFGPDARSIASSGSAQYFNVGQPTMNSSGQVAFLAVPNGSNAFQTVLDTAGVITVMHKYASSDSIGIALRMNDNAIVAFHYRPSGQQDVIARTDGTTIVTNGSSGFTTLFDPSINNSGQVAFIGTRNGARGIYIGDGTGPAVTVADTNGPLSVVHSRREFAGSCI